MIKLNINRNNAFSIYLNETDKLNNLFLYVTYTSWRLSRAGGARLCKKSISKNAESTHVSGCRPVEFNYDGKDLSNKRQN